MEMNQNDKLQCSTFCKPEFICFARVGVLFDDRDGYSVSTLGGGIYGIRLDQVDTNVAEEIRPLLKQDLIEGNDRFLVGTYDYTDSGFSFEMFMYNIEFDKDFFIESEYNLARALINDNIQTPTIITFK